MTDEQSAMLLVTLVTPTRIMNYFMGSLKNALCLQVLKLNLQIQDCSPYLEMNHNKLLSQLHGIHFSGTSVESRDLL